MGESWLRHLLSAQGPGDQYLATRGSGLGEQRLQVVLGGRPGDHQQLGDLPGVESVHGQTEHTVHDYDTWREAFDRYEGFRKERGVQSYRIARDAADPQRLLVDLDFDDAAAALEFRGALEKIWATPLSQQQMIKHGDALVLNVVAHQTL